MATKWVRGVAVAALLVAGVAVATPLPEECVISGTVTAEPNPDDPSLGLWRYCLEANWQIDPPHDLSHLDIMLALGECECICEEFPFAALDSAGTSSGVDSAGADCTVYYYAEFLCDGDPSIDVFEPLVKFEPYEGDCEPEPIGSGIFCFYTDWAPIEVSLPNDLLVVKGGQVVCFGEVTGFLPECDCGSSPSNQDTWGTIKARFRE